MAPALTISDPVSPDQILDFWRQAGPDRWFSRDDAFDALCRDGFEGVWQAARDGRLAGWADAPSGALALVVILDQLPRNMWRGTPDAYATDPQARHVAAVAIARGFDRDVDPALRRFFYLPFMHSEDLADQDRSLALNTELGEDATRWARHHRDIIVRFGRFPHRNAILGRPSTPEEKTFMADGDAFRG